MNDSIRRFLQDKDDGFIGEGGLDKDDNRVDRYPVHFLCKDGFLIHGWLQDVVEEHSKGSHYLKLSVLTLGKLYTDEIYMYCKTDYETSEIPWDSLTFSNVAHTR
jgi:hypothetical protein